MSGLVLFLPLATVLLPLAAFGKFVADSEHFMRSPGSSSLLALFPVLLSFYLSKLKLLHSRLSSFIGWIQLLLSVCAAVLLIWPALHHKDSAPGNIPSSLSWEQLQTFCPSVEPETQTEVNANLRCSQLVGAPISWEGRVATAKVVRVSNPLALIISRLPLSVKDSLTCLLGEPYRECEAGKYCQPSPFLINKCHLANWDRYDVEVDVWMNSAGLWKSKDSLVTLTVDHTFLNFTRSLVPGDRVWFAGLLSGDGSGLLPRLRPRVSLLELGCLSCQNSDLGVARKPQLLTAFTIRDLYSGIKTILNFLFNPLVIFR